jgi:hypothetical protein
MLKRLFRGVVCAGLGLALGVAAGCVSYTHQTGVDNRWRQAPPFEEGKTTQAEVLDQLGPPSQIIALGDRTALYYLLEQGRGRGLILLLYNRVEDHVAFDRAIFFIGADGVLTDFAYSAETLEYE